MRTRQRVPEGLGAMAPGAELASVLAGLDLSRLVGTDLVTVVQAWDRQLAWSHAHWLDSLLELGLDQPGPDDAPHRSEWLLPFAEAEVRAALTCSKQVAIARQNEAAMVRWSLPAVGVALAAGRIDASRMKVFLAETADVDTATAQAAVAEVLPEAGGLTPGELAARLRELVCALDPEAAAARYEAGVASRRFAALRNRDGTVDLCGRNLPVERAVAAVARVDRLMTALRSAGHPGRRRELSTDVFLGLLDGRWEAWSDAEIVAALLAALPREEGASAADPPAPAAGPAPSAPDPSTADPADPGPDDPGPDDPGLGDPDPGGPPIPPPPPPSPGGPTPSGGVGRRSSRPRVALRAELGTLLGLDLRPGELAALGQGTHPVPAALCRALVESYRRARWRLVLIDDRGHLHAATTTRARPLGSPPDDVDLGWCAVVEVHLPLADLPGLLAAPDPRWLPVLEAFDRLARRPPPPTRTVDPTRRDPRRHPDAALEDDIRTRDQRCVFPGCRTPALACQIDHTRPWGENGPSLDDNLGPLCGGDHRLKSLGRWGLRQTDSGSFVWTAPSGATYARPRRPLRHDLPPPRAGRVPPRAAGVASDGPDDSTDDDTPVGAGLAGVPPVPRPRPPRRPRAVEGDADLYGPPGDDPPF